LGVLDLYSYSHINQVYELASFKQQNITKISSILSKGDAEKLVYAFITSWLDY